ncbi:surface-adhesin E family protein [Humitalea sp. 24SJ18S-53]|uniref:surface-adhesin E family protein n=1 Tax=Humitalea sp. 24SJ18S-53 TaxID=3422307 RepID=UPI003D6662BF
MATSHTIAVLFLLAVGAGCTAVEPQPAEAAPPAAVAPVVAAEALPAMPAIALAPRRTWRRLPVAADGPIAEAFAASPVTRHPSGLRRVWLVMNLAEPIHMPETGGQARSVAYLADYRCDRPAWHPVQGNWYRDRNAVGLIVRDLPRGPDALREVRNGTLVDVLVDAACAL